MSQAVQHVCVPGVLASTTELPACNHARPLEMQQIELDLKVRPLGWVFGGLAWIWMHGQIDILSGR